MSDAAGTSNVKPWGVLALVLGVVMASAILGWQRTLIGDEIWSVHLASVPWSESWSLATLDRVNTPVAPMLLRGWLALFGKSDMSVKLFPLVPAVLMVFGLFWWRRPRLETAILLIAAALWYGRIGGTLLNVRAYALVLPVVLLTAAAWKDWLDKAKAKSLTVWAVSFSLAIWLHLSAVFLWPAFVLGALVTRRSWRSWVAWFLLPVLAGAVWTLFTLRSITAHDYFNHLELTRVVLAFPFTFLTGEDPGGGSALFVWYQSAGQSVLVIALAGLAAVLVLALAVVFVRRLRLDDPWGVTCTAAVLLPPATLLAFSLPSVPLLYGRYVLVSLPFLWVLVAEAWRDLKKVEKVPVLLAAGWAAGGVLLSAWLNAPPDPTRSASQHVAEAVRADDVILSPSVSFAVRFHWEWTQRLGKNAQQVKFVTYDSQPPMAVGAEVVLARSRVLIDTLRPRAGQRVWLVGAADRLNGIDQILPTFGFVPEPAVSRYVRSYSARSP